MDSLLEMALRAATKSVRSITDIGDCPYELIRSVLLRIENPEQLRQLEVNSPQVVGKTQEIWLNLIKRDVPDWEVKIIHPNNPDNWWKVYRKLKKDLKKDNEAGEALLKARLSGIKTEREENFARLTTKKPAPGIGRRTKNFYSHTSGRTGAGRGSAPTNFFDKMKRDAGRPSPRMAIPTHRLADRSSRITRAPLSMVEEIRARKQNSPPITQSQPTLITGSRTATSLVRPPKVSKTATQRYDMTQDREDRLRRLKTGQGSTTTNDNSNKIDGTRRAGNGLSEDFLEEDDDAMFDDSSSEGQHDVTVTSAKGRHPTDVHTALGRSAKRKDPPALFHSPAKRAVR